MKKVSIYLKLLGIFIVFLILSFYITGLGSNDFVKVILTIASFVFGVILAFSISNRHSRLGGIRESLRESDAVMLNIYELSKVFGTKIFNQIKNKLDALLIIQIDYNLFDFDNSVKKIKELYEFIENMAVRKKSQAEPQKIMLKNAEELLKMEKEVSYHVKNEMLGYEWASLLILAAVILFCIFYLKDSSVILSLITAVIATALVLLILVLKELDSLQWQENNWIWDPLSNLFIELGLLPYFSDDLFESNRINIKNINSLNKIRKIRVAHYPNPYPDRAGKTIEIVKL